MWHFCGWYNLLYWSYKMVFLFDKNVAFSYGTYQYEWLVNGIWWLTWKEGQWAWRCTHGTDIRMLPNITGIVGVAKRVSYLTQLLLGRRIVNIWASTWCTVYQWLLQQFSCPPLWPKYSDYQTLMPVKRVSLNDTQSCKSNLWHLIKIQRFFYQYA